MRKRFSFATLAAALAGLGAAAPAHATLVFQTGAAKTHVWIANDDGSGARKLATGALPHISPDGQTVAYVTSINTDAPNLKVIPAAGGTARTLVKRWQYGLFDWSPDSRYILATAGRFSGFKRLVLADVATAGNRTIARGFFDGASFSPDSTELVYALRNTEIKLFPKENLHTASITSTTTRRLTTDGHSLYPVWGPQKIAFVVRSRATGKHRKDEGPKFNLGTIAADGSGRTQITHDKVPFLLSGLVPTDWSADGTRLLAQFGGQDTTYAVTVNPLTGKERIVSKASRGIVGTALSRDGSTILGYTDAAAGDPRLQAVGTAKYGHGGFSVLLAKSSSPDWNR